MRAIVAIARGAGRRVGRLLLYPICAYFLMFSPKARAASRHYLRRALGRDPTWRDQFRHYHCFGRQLLDRVHALDGDFSRLDYSVEGLEVLQAALGSGRGVLLVGAHVGSFEFIRVVGSRDLAARLHVMMYGQDAEKLAGVLAQVNPAAAPRIIALGRPGTMLEVRDALVAGDMVGMLADRVIAGDRVRTCNFFGVPAAFAEGPFVLAAAVGAPVVLFSVTQDGGGAYRIRFDAFEDRVELPRTERDAALQRLCERYAAWLEACCRAAPYNWFNFYDFWAQATPRAQP